MARPPEAAWTLVATRRKSPDGVFWKIVTVAPVIDLISSTTGVGTATSPFCPSHWLPTSTRGSSTGVTSPESWFLASQRDGHRAGRAVDAESAGPRQDVLRDGEVGVDLGRGGCALGGHDVVHAAGGP